MFTRHTQVKCLSTRACAAQQESGYPAVIIIQLMFRIIILVYTGCVSSFNSNFELWNKKYAPIVAYHHHMFNRRCKNTFCSSNVLKFNTQISWFLMFTVVA